ncbi:MAG: YihY family inner membrane protein [Actinobacteria bacterium]|nr:YihY family inner membrane protein [Actinomycetota bacterium]
MSKARAFLYQQIVLSYLVARAFIQDRLLVRASALVYATLLSIVPLLAVMFSLLKGFGFHNKLEPILYKVMAPLGEQAIQTVVPAIVGFVDNVNVGALGGVGFLFLFLSVLSIINNTERAFNDIWKVQHVRSLHRRFSDYLSVLLLGPVLLFTILGITASIQSFFVVQAIGKIPGISFFFNKTAPIIASWFAFLFLYIFIPNTKVKAGSAFFGAVFAGTIWQVSNVFFARFIVTSYQEGAKAALYAGFATLPLFLVWLFLSWAIVLLGAEISYAHQNVNKITWEVRNTRYSQKVRDNLALRIILIIGKKFYHGELVPTSGELADHLRVPERLLNDILTELVEIGLLYPIEGDAIRYAPAKSLENLSLDEIMIGLRTHGVNDLPVDGEDELGALTEKIQSDYEKALAVTFKNTCIKDILRGIKKT